MAAWAQEQAEAIAAAQAEVDDPAASTITLMEILETAYTQATGEQPTGLFQNMQVSPTDPEGEGAAYGAFSSLEVQGEGFAAVQYILPVQFRDTNVAPEDCPSILAWGYLRIRVSVSPLSFEVSMHVDSDLEGAHDLVMLDDEEEVALNLEISAFPYDYTLSAAESDAFLECIDGSPMILAGSSGFPASVVAATEGPAIENSSVCYATLLDDQGGGALSRKAGFQYFPKTTSLVMTCNVQSSWGIEPTGLALRDNQGQATVDLGDPPTPYFSYMFSPDEVARLWAPGGFEYVELTYDNGIAPDLALSGAPTCYDHSLVGMVMPIDFFLLGNTEGEGAPEQDDTITGRLLLLAHPTAFSISMHLDLSELSNAEEVQIRNPNNDIVFSRPVYGPTFDHLFQDCEVMDFDHFVITTTAQPSGALVGVPHNPEPNGTASYSPGCITPWEITIENASQAPVYAQALTVELPRGWSYAGTVSSTPPASEPPVGTTGSFTLIFQEIATFPLNIRLNLMPGGTPEMGQMGNRQVRYRVQSLTELGISDTGMRNLTFTPGASPQAEGEGEGETGCTAGGGYTALDAFAPDETNLTVHDFLAEFYFVMQEWDNDDNIDKFDFNGVNISYMNIPNGIADKAEFALLIAVLTDTSAPCHEEVYAAFLANRASIDAFIIDELGACYTGAFIDRAIVDTLALYSTLGEDSNWVTNTYLRELGNMNGCYPTPDISYAQSYPPCVAPDGDIDGDGLSNLEEWEVAGWYELLHGKRRVDYVRLALDADLPLQPITDIRRVEVHIEAEGNGSVEPEPGVYFMAESPLMSEDCQYVCDHGAPAPGTTPVDCPDCVHTLTLHATPEGEDTAFSRWMGSVDNIGTSTLSVGLDRTHWLTAVFVERPGVGDLDLPGALANVVALTELEIASSEFDWNGLANYEEDPELERSGNGIPDSVEFALLQAALQDATLDLARRAGLVNDYLWPVWEQNLAQATDDLVGESDDLIMVTAAYMTLGDYRSVEAAESLLQKTVSGFEALPDRDAYDRSRQRFFRGTGDADNDGLSNVEEWQHAEALAAANPGESALAMFPALALGGSVNVENPAFPPSEGEGEGEGEGEIDCRPSYTVTVPNSPGFRGEATAGPSAVRSGDKISVKYEEMGEAYFTLWASAGMATSSLAMSESFPAAANVSVVAGYSSAEIYVKESGGEFNISSSGPIQFAENIEGWQAFYGPSDQTVRVSATTSDPDKRVYAWELLDAANGGFQGYLYGRSIAVRLATGGALRPLAQPKTMPLPELVAVSASASRGVFVDVASTTADVAGAPGGAAVRKSAVPEGAGVVATPYPGFRMVNTPGNSLRRHLTNVAESTKVEFQVEEDGLKELILETSDPKGGTVNVAEGETPKRRWDPNTIVEVEAIAHPGWVFAGWAGDPFNDSMAQIAQANGIDPEKSKRGKLKMDKDKTKTAIFKEPKPCDLPPGN